LKTIFGVIFILFTFVLVIVRKLFELTVLLVKSGLKILIILI